MSNLATLASSLATSLGMDDGSDLIQTLKATAFKGQVSDSQMTALLIVAKSYGLNPWTRELYAFPDKGGIVPVVGVDGWSRIINSHSQFDGMDFEQDAESCTCIIYRKDRGHPIRVTEWMDECKRNAGPWLSHPKRMLRHKAMIQAARLAFGFAGIYDSDEAERIVQATSPERVDAGTGEIIEFDLTVAKAALHGAQTPEELSALWASYFALAKSVGDSAIAPCKELHALYKELKAGLENVTDVEAK